MTNYQSAGIELRLGRRRRTAETVSSESITLQRRVVYRSTFASS